MKFLFSLMITICLLISPASFSQSLTGGTITTDGNYTIHTFTSSGTLNVPSSISAEVLVVAGGGGGGSGNGGGGGGAGGVVYAASHNLSAGNISVTVGSGGIAGTGTGVNGGNGGNSLFDGITALGGGGGASCCNGAGLAGGSGGGSSRDGSNGTPGGTATQTNSGGGIGYGNIGGSYQGNGAAGGGGAGGSGGNSTGDPNTTGNGGVGLEFPQFASVGGSPAGWFAGGGGGALYCTCQNNGGQGGGGNGTTNQTSPIATAGVANTGGGGGGGTNQSWGSAAQSGGSGIVIIRYLTPVQCVPNSSSETVSACVSYLWRGMELTNSGTYYDTLTNVGGCDSILTLNLTINSLPNVSIANSSTVQICNKSTPYGNSAYLYTNSISGVNYTWNKISDNVSWQHIGSAGGFTPSSSAKNSIAVDNGTPYIAFENGVNSDVINVMKFDGNNWVYVGGSSTIKTHAFFDFLTTLKIAINNGVPYVAYIYFDAYITGTYVFGVVKFDGNNWVDVGSPDIAQLSTDELSMSFDNDTLYVATIDDGNGKQRASVRKFDGTNWVLVGNAGFSPQNTSKIDLQIVQGQPVLSFNEFSHASHLTINTRVMGYNGTTWQNMGSSSNELGDFNSPIGLQYDNGNLYVAHSPFISFDSLYIKTWNGSNWVQAAPAVAFNASSKTAFSAENGIFYAMHEINGVGQLLRYKSSKWDTLSGGNFSTVSIPQLNMLSENGIIYTSYTNSTNGDKTSMEKSVYTLDSLGSTSNYTTSDSGEYVLIGTDQNGCSAKDTIQVIVNTLLSTVLVNSNVSCPGDNNGSVTAQGIGGFSPYTFIWDQNAGSQNVATATSLAPGNYSVTVTDNSGCVSISSATVSTIGEVTYDTVSISACNSYNWQGKNLTLSGTYLDTLQSVAGCDSFLVLNLSISTNPILSNDTVFAEYVTFPTTLDTIRCNALLTDTFTSQFGCDSIVTLSFFYSSVQNIQFNQVATTSSPQVLNNFIQANGAAVDFADIDGDSDFDVLISGNNSTSLVNTKLYTNDGNGNFTEVSSNPFVQVNSGSVDFADVDGDNDQDVLITGFDDNNLEFVAKLYQNDGSGSFTLVSGTPFPGVQASDAAFADLDGDNDNDLIISGTGMGNFTKLFTNNGSGGFTENTNTTFDAVFNSSIDIADVDGDNDLDIIIAGQNSSNQPQTKLYLNNGTGTFTQSIGNSFVGIYSGDIAFGDLDGDNDQDVIISGSTGQNSSESWVYNNDGVGNFTLSTQLIIHTNNSTITIVDIDGDLDQDLFITGNSNTMGPISTLFINDGSGNLSQQNGMPFFAESESIHALADLNGDDKLDVFITGNNSYATSIWLNNTPNPFPQVSQQNHSACNSYTWINGITYTSSINGVIDTLTNSRGCDSLVSLNLTILNSTSSTLTISACESYNWQGNLLTQSGTYYDTLTNAIGCDSLLILNLTINPLPNASITNGDTTTFCFGDSVILSSTNQTGFTYSWKTNIQAWQQIGSPAFAYADAKDIKVYNGTPYLAFVDTANNNKVTVMTFDGNTWNTIGTPGFGPLGNNRALEVSLAIDNGTAYVAYQDQNTTTFTSTVTVMSFNGSSWNALGNPNFVNGSSIDLMVDNGIPYLGFSDNSAQNKASVMKFDGSTWSLVGGVAASSGSSENNKLKIINGQPTVAFTNSGSASTATVMSFDGSSWQTLGNPSTEFGAYTSVLGIEQYGGLTYLAFYEALNSNLLKIKTWDGSNWSQIATPGFNLNSAFFARFTLNNGTPYVFHTQSNTGEVRKFDGNNWVEVSGGNFSTKQIIYFDIVAEQGKVYTAYSDLTNGGKVSAEVLGSSISEIDSTSSYSTSTEGIYILKVTNQNGCISNDTVFVESPNQLIVSANESQAVSVYQGNDGVAAASVSGGSAPYSYVWSNGDTANTANNLTVDTFYVTVTDINGCSDSTSVQITGPLCGNPVANCKSINAYLDNNGNVSISANDLNDSSYASCGIDSFAIIKNSFSKTFDFSTSSIPSEFITVGPKPWVSGVSATGWITAHEILKLGNNANSVSDRTYLVTKDANFINKDFVFEFTHYAGGFNDESDLYIGMGSPGQGGTEPFLGVFAKILSPGSYPDHDEFFVKDSTFSQLLFTHQTLSFSRYKIKLVKSGYTLRLFMENLAFNNGYVQIGNDINLLSSSFLGLNNTNTHLFFGTGNSNNSFDNLTLTISNDGFSSQNSIDLDCDELGNIITDFIVIDNNGNSDTCSSTISVLDTIAPTVICQNLTAFLNQTGNYTLSVDSIDNNSFDNCGISQRSLSKTSFTQADLGTNSIILTIQDESGNTASCTAMLTLLSLNSDSTFTASSCNSYQWLGNTFSQSGTYYDTLPNNLGGDSLMTLNLTIRNATSESFTADVCGSYDWMGKNLAVSGTYFDTIPNSQGCDSLMTLNLTIRNSTSESFTVDACGSYNWMGKTLTASGTYYDTIPNAAGCDSVLTLDLTINQPTSWIDTVVACGSYTWIDNNVYTSSNNTATVTLTNAANCDSVVTLNLTINQPTSWIDTVVACGSYTWIDNNVYTSSNNTATFTLQNAAGCDSVVTLDLTINQPTSWIDTVVACGSYTWIDNNVYSSSNSTATFTLQNALGCDSVVTLDLTINQPTSWIDTVVTCGSYTWIDNNVYTSSNNTATVTLTNSVGCDSVVTLNLTINNSNTGIDTIVACNSYTWIDGQTYTASNTTATHTLQNVSGCDSVVTLDLTINNSNTGIDTIVACNSYTWIDGQTYTASNNSATFTLQNASGCDSVVTLDLIINYSNTGIDTIVACDTYTWIDGQTYTASNTTATHTLQNVSGCDSVVTLDLTINNATISTLSDTACGSYDWMGMTYIQSGTYMDTIPNAAGCDSLMTLNLTITGGFTVNVSDTICNGDSILLGGMYVNVSGMYSDTLQTAQGCDSVIVTDLSVTPGPSITIDTLNNVWCNQVSFLVNSNETGLSYMWSNNETTDQIQVSLTDGLSQSYSVTAMNPAGCMSNMAMVNYNAADFIESYTILANHFMRLRAGNKVLNGAVGVRNQNGIGIVDNFSGPMGANGFIKSDSILVRNNTQYDTLLYGASLVGLPFHNTSMVIPRNFDTIYAQVGAVKNEFRKNVHVVAYKNSTVILNNNRYGDITVHGGATVTFTQPNVEITNLYLKNAATKSNSAKVKFNQATNLRVRNRVELGKRAVLNPDSQMVTIYIGGGTQARHFKVTPKGVDSYANVYVDNGNIEVRNILLPSRTNLTGRFIADTVMAKDKNVVWNWSECLMQTPPPAALLANKVATPTESVLPEVTEQKVGNMSLQLAPNPSRGMFMLNLTTTNATSDRLDIRITSQDGSLVMEKQMANFKGRYVEEIDMSGLSNGVYFINIISGETMIHEKLILTR